MTVTESLVFDTYTVLDMYNAVVFHITIFRRCNYYYLWFNTTLKAFSLTSVNCYSGASDMMVRRRSFKTRGSGCLVVLTLTLVSNFESKQPLPYKLPYEKFMLN